MQNNHGFDFGSSPGELAYCTEKLARLRRSRLTPLLLSVMVCGWLVAGDGVGFMDQPADRGGAVAHAASADVYTCPMDPEVRSDKPGSCPKCGMFLQKVAGEQSAPSAGPVPPSKNPAAQAPEKPSQEVYICPMHPEVQSDKPGSCPKCGMFLEKVPAEKAPPPPAQPQSSGKPAGELVQKSSKDVYICPMHPQVRSDKPGSCPICGMNLEKMPEQGALPGGEPMPAGTVHIRPERQQLIGVQLGEVEEKSLSGTVRAVGRLALDETRVARVQTRIEGWIDQVFVDFTGKSVRKGQPLFSVYSPELVATQQELIISRKSLDKLKTSTFPEARTGAETLYRSTRERLRLWDLSDAQIREIERRGTPSRSVTLYAPQDGFVLTRNAYPGQRITPETELYVIADLSRLWVLADVYEYELPLIQVGQKADLTLTAFPGRVFHAKVSFIYPQVEASTRTLKVRLDLPNPDHLLKPDLYAQASFAIDHGRELVVPQESVLDSGTEQTVFVARGNGYFEPRTVSLGRRVANDVVVLKGLSAGEKVVTSA
ncbi:MAG: efflux RND transporter periplasmic adaptor subunit, partial [Syntrophobacteraceae bacterium]|nr:efflux RND transporter periplasmic adaptor subunit [Syntrophobacteraceae bacterium]